MIERLAIARLAMERGGRRLLSDFNLEVRAGEAVVLVGANGVGKTSLLRLIAGLSPPTAGTIDFIGGAGPLGAEDARSAGLHLLGHADGLKGARTAGEELLFAVNWLGGSDADARRGAERLGVADLLRTEVRRLSAGQRRRIALARLAAVHRDLWLLDEPLAPLDARARAGLGGLMAEHLAEGGLILAASHEPPPIAARTVELGP